MNYFVIIRGELIDGEVVHTPYGYLTSIEDLEPEVVEHLKSFSNWVEANKTDLENEVINVSKYFDTNNSCHQLGWETNNLDGSGIREIIEIVINNN
jgi:transketolase N-terminal domain/subunit